MDSAISVGSEEIVLVLVVVTALAFDFTNGFHDTANAMATSIATRALSRCCTSSPTPSAAAQTGPLLICAVAAMAAFTLYESTQRRERVTHADV